MIESPRINESIISEIIGSRPSVGSSINNMGGSETILRAIDTISASPTLNVPARRSLNEIKPNLSIVSFRPEALKRFALHKKTSLEKIEDVELLRALEIGIRIKSINLKGDSFSVDVIEDYFKAKKQILRDKFFKLYNEN